MATVKGGRALALAQVGEGFHRKQRCNPGPDGGPEQGDRRSSTQPGQGRHPQQQRHHQGLNPAGTHPAVIHRLQPAVSRSRQAIGRIHQPVEMQTAAEADAQGQHQRDLHQEPGGRQQLPQSGFQEANGDADPGRKASDALKARGQPRRQRQDAVEDPSSSPVPEHAGGQQRWV